MAELWFGLLAVTLIAYSVLDGFDFGVGAIAWLVGKTEAERGDVIAAIGPFWDGNEVWLIASGGVLFVAFPSVLALAFPAFYLALFVALWSLILRGISLEVRGHVTDAMWRALWDVIFSGSSALLALLFGVALGNVVRGVPIGPDGDLTMPFFTDFSPRGAVGLLDYYTLSVGILALAVLAAHGACFLVWRTDGPLRERAVLLGRRLWLAAGGLFVVVTVETWSVRPDLFVGLARRPLGWACAAIAVAGAVTIARTLRDGSRLPKQVLSARSHSSLHGFVGSSALIAGVLGATAAGTYPELLASTLDPVYGVRADQALSAPYGLRVALVWWPIAFALAVSYFTIVFRVNRRKV